MKKVILTILALLAVGILVVVAIAATRPGTYAVERSAEIAAPPARVYTLVNDFHHWPQWSPWEKLDPAMSKTFGGAPSGEGATYAWSGNDQVGEGTMTIVESEPDSRVGIQLEFVKPWESTSRTDFTFVPAGAGTRVNWRMTGENDFTAKLFTVFMDMDQMIGKDFETGLANLKSVAEGPAPVDTLTPDTLTTVIPRDVSPVALATR